MARFVDLRSDTVTKPTEKMRQAMYEAEVGDDFYREDPTVTKLEEMLAKMLGKEAGLFVTSGTMANLIALLTHTHPGESVVVERDAHVLRCEGGHMAAVAGCLPKPVRGHKGLLYPEDIEPALIGQGVLYATTTLLWVENTHNSAGGTCTTVELMQETRKIADKYGLKIHVDGERIFNAAVALNVNPEALVKEADSVQVGLSKGLGCPFGSVLLGSREFIEKARKKRQMIGGGMRQAGIMAAAGIVALETMIDRLQEDHENAKILAQGLAELGMQVDMETVQTNIVFFEIPPSMIDPHEFVLKLRTHGVLVNPPSKGSNRIRMVTHYGIERSDIDYTLKVIEEVISNA